MDIDVPKLKIAQIVGNASSGGVISCVLNFYRHVDREKFQFDFYTYGESPYDEEIRLLGGRVFYIPDVKNVHKAVSTMKKYFVEEKYYAVHAHLTTLSFLPLFAAKLAKVPHRICHAHSTTHKKENVWLLKNILKHFSSLFATRLAGCSQYSIEWLYGKNKSERAFLLHNAIDINRFDYCEEKDEALLEKYGLSDKKVVGSIGRFVFQKNYTFLIDAFKILSDKEKDAVLVLVGDGKEKHKIEEKIKYYNLGNKVYILPECQTVEDYYKMFDIFVLPSRFEGLPLVAVEAQAVGIPCLLSEEMTKEVNITEECEFLPIKSPKAWSDKMQEMLKNNFRCDDTEKIINAGYELATEAVRLTQFYLGLEDK